MIFNRKLHAKVDALHAALEDTQGDASTISSAMALIRDELADLATTVPKLLRAMPPAVATTHAPDSPTIDPVVTLERVGDLATYPGVECSFVTMTSGDFGVPSGSVTLYDNNRAMPGATAELFNGTADFRVTFPFRGRHVLKARYSGNSTYRGLDSAGIWVIVV